MRKSRIKFWEKWLQDMHTAWDGKEEQTFLLAPTQMMLPDAQYKQEVPRPAGVSEAEVSYPISNLTCAILTVLLTAVLTKLCGQSSVHATP